MTVSYQYDVASSASGGFIRLLFRWRGSVWKVVYREMTLFTLCYILLAVLYNFVLSGAQKGIFEGVVHFCSMFMNLIPLPFMLGFYVSLIATRWWNQFVAIPWPDKLMNIVAMYIPGLDEASRVVRRTLMRYLNLSLVLVLRSISMAVKRRFPTKEHLVEAGFMTKTELEMFQSVPSTEFNTFWIPCTWFINVLREAKQECRITDSNGLKLIMEEMNEFRSKCGLLWGYDWISIPLVYTQVVTMATYAFFVACMFGRQRINSTDPAIKNLSYDYYFPLFTILELMFYMGLLKVAEQLINPFGDDDEDFELNWIIDRHMKVSYLGVDTLNGTPPPLVKDTYYNELDVKIPYTEASRGYKKKTYRGSVAYMQVPMEKQGLVLPDMSEDEDDDEGASENMGARRPSLYTLFGNKTANCKGPSPSSSIINLDADSLDSDWKGSLTNVIPTSAGGAKNASGTLGFNKMSAPLLEMSKAEDDEIILHEVIIEPTSLQTVSKSDDVNFSSPTVDTSDKSHGHKSLSLMNVLRQISPKIAPKFPREKLKSMIRKSRKISPGFPYHKVKGVTFSTDTKSDDDDESEQSSLLDLSVNDPLEVEITLSTPELTEIEKRMGIHPYCFLRDHISPSEPVPTFRSPSLARDQDKTEAHFPGYTVESVAHQIPETPTRSQSLPNIHEGVMKEGGIRSLVMVPSLNKYHHIREKRSRTRKRQKRKKSPPPLLLSGCEREFLSNTQSEFEQIAHSSESSSRRNTLPKITVTRCEQKSPDHLDLATAASGRISSDSNNINNNHPSRDRQNSRESKSIDKSPTAYSFSEDPSPDCSKTFQRPKSLKYSPDSSATGIQKSKPPYKQMSQKHSTPQGSTKLPSTSSTCSPASAQPSKASTSSTKSKILHTFTPSPQTYSKKGLRNVSDSAPSTPTSDIPPVFRVSRSPSFPNASQAPQRPKSLRSSSTPVSSEKTPEVEAGSPVGQESVRQSVAGIVSESDGKAISFQRTKTGDHSQSPETSPGPPRPPPRPAPRRGSRGKK